MGDIYHNGNIIGSNLSIDDSQVGDKITWSSEKINSEIEEIKEVEEYDKTNGITLDSAFNHSGSSIFQKYANGITIICAQLYATTAKAKNTWYTVATIQNHKPPKNRQFVGVTYNGTGVAYGYINSTGEIKINTEMDLTGTSPVGQVYFNFSY